MFACDLGRPGVTQPCRVDAPDTGGKSRTITGYRTSATDICLGVE
jgi:hypothetical protein